MIQKYWCLRYEVESLVLHLKIICLIFQEAKRKLDEANLKISELEKYIDDIRKSKEDAEKRIAMLLKEKLDKENLDKKNSEREKQTLEN